MKGHLKKKTKKNIIVNIQTRIKDTKSGFIPVQIYDI